jgi:glycogen debranching enzyme
VREIGETAGAMSNLDQFNLFRASIITLLVHLSLISMCPQNLFAQTASNPSHNFGALVWSSDSTQPHRFVSVHGRRAAVFGYSEDGLEVWAYPVQILNSYSLSFCQPGASSETSGRSLLRSIVYSPESVTRIYAGPDFIVRERIFVPIDEPGTIISYESDGTHPVNIMVHFNPVLDLMWPASIGGQAVTWDSSTSSYLLFEPEHRFAASIGSLNIVAHDSTANDTRHPGRLGLTFTLRVAPSDNTMRVVIAEGSSPREASTKAKQLADETNSLQSDAARHYSALLDDSLQIETPDADVNRALAWSQIALDQSWVCNPDLGCGLVAGYGPSRRARRPQYDWFFAGDGMVAIDALLAEGQYDRARQELEFILRYQDQKTGMVWHELSQSAGLLDWMKYPYMYRHVDLTFDFLETIDKYFMATGDLEFVKRHWSSVQSAYEFCQSLVDSKDGLPRIPSDKQGSREQDSLSDELALSATWVAASEAFSELAVASGHNDSVDRARIAGRQAQAAIKERYWDEEQHFWITGYTRSGSALADHSLSPVAVLDGDLFSDQQTALLLDQLSSSEFETDWGTRGRASNATSYDANSYASGSVWATGTARTAEVLWWTHRPATAFPIWRSLISWSSLDSLGHMHEALAGDFYHEERESVPEQTWSSAAFLTSFVNGLLGWRPDATANRAIFAPSLEGNWSTIKLRNLRVGTSKIGIDMTMSAGEIDFEMQNEGIPIDITVDPEIPLGAELRRAWLAGHPISVSLEKHPQASYAKVEFRLAHGKTSLRISYIGGVMPTVDAAHPTIGESSKTLRITGIELRDRIYTINFDYLPSEVSHITLRSPWGVRGVDGATLENVSPAMYRLTVRALGQQQDLNVYRHGRIIVTFESGPFQRKSAY